MSGGQTKFWTVAQNNSQGVFDHVPERGIGYAVCVEAINEDEAKERLWAIFGSYTQGPYCPCCGDRWGTDFLGEGYESPSLYGRPLAGKWGMPSYVHHYDVRIEERPK